MPRSRLALGLASLAVSFALAGCCSGDDPGASNNSPDAKTPTPLDGFAGYCTATLLTEQRYLAFKAPGEWVSRNNTGTVPAGTVFLLSGDDGNRKGYTLLSDGAPVVLWRGVGEGLKEGTDFESACASTVKRFGDVRVLLRESSFYETKDLTGTACTLPRATRLTDYSGGTGLNETVAAVSAREVEDKCGWDTAYSADMAYGELYPLASN